MRLDGISINKQSSIRIDGSLTLYFDPWDRKESNDADIIFITHEHFDHFSPKDISRLRKNDTILVAPHSMKEIIEKKLLFEREDILYTEPSKEYGVKSIKFSTYPMYNKSGVKFHTKEMGWCGYKAVLDNTSYYIMGDTNVQKEHLEIRCDVLFIPIGGYYTMGYEEAADYTLKIKPKYAIPTHYGSVVGDKKDGERYLQAVEKENRDINVLLLI